jgi:transcriptional regulator with XRE-family HTH domain
MVTIAENIKQRRLAMGMPEQILAKELGLNLGTYEVLESQNQNINYTKLLKLSQHLQSNAAALVSINESDRALFDAELLLAQIKTNRWRQVLLREIRP